jgi:hypothetical protein
MSDIVTRHTAHVCGPVCIHGSCVMRCNPMMWYVCRPPYPLPPPPPPAPPYRTSQKMRGHLCPKFAPRARDSRRVPRFASRVPRFALQRHRAMTNLSTYFSSLSLEIPSLDPHRDYNLCTSIFNRLIPPPYFGQRNTRLGYLLGHFSRCSSDRQIRHVYIFN